MGYPGALAIGPLASSLAVAIAPLPAAGQIRTARGAWALRYNVAGHPAPAFLYIYMHVFTAKKKQIENRHAAASWSVGSLWCSP